MVATASDPGFINANAGAPSYSANELRQLFALPLQYNGRVFGARQGVRPGGDALQTSIAGSTITVKAGIACVDPGLTTAQGPYSVVNPNDATLALTAAHATLPRKDITILRVYDNDEDSSGQRQGIVEYIAGSAAGSPSEPAVPAGAIKLATIDVPASGGGSPSVTINFAFTVAAGGVLPVRNATERTALTPFDGFAIYRQDRDWVEIYDGAAWRVQGTAVCSSTADRDSAITSPYSGQLAYTTDTATLWVRQGGAWFLYIDNSVPMLCTADTTRNNNTTLLNVTGMSVALPVGKYTFEGSLAYTTNATADIKFAMAVTGTFTGWIGYFGEYITGAGTVGDLAAFRETSFTNVQLLGGSDTASGNMLCRPGGYIDVTVAATLQLQFAQNTANASDTIVRNGSHLYFKKVG